MNDMEDRISAACAFVGGVLLGLGTSMHPMQADPNNAAAAFAEYAVDRNWIGSHLLQFVGAALLVAFLLLLARQLRGSLAVLRPLASGGAIASLAVAAALQAVDGVALKAAVDAWAGAPGAEKPAAFSAAFAVRQIEIGLASLLSILFGATAALYGLLLYGDGRYPTWIGSVAVAGGIGFTAGGVVIAYGGFSPAAMNLQMPASLLLLTWIVAVAAILWRRSHVPPAR
ncbi:MAG TPA: hypothetical protein VFK79_15520 [Xanthobacteraceae bacterium]|nr:hypothetical protein [Xanthobacteraceae bacterium]